MTQPDALEAEAVRAVRDALAVVRRYRLAEVEIVLSSDRVGVVHLRHQVRMPLPVGGVESSGGAG